MRAFWTMDTWFALTELAFSRAYGGLNEVFMDLTVHALVRGVSGDVTPKFSRAVMLKRVHKES